MSISALGRLGTELNRSFARRAIPIWVTEYGSETKPGEPKGVTEAQQARYLGQAVAIASKDPRVKMFVWFVFRSSTRSSWQSGLYRLDGTPKPAAGALGGGGEDRRPAQRQGERSRAAPPNPLVNVNYRDMCTNNVPGTTVGVTLARPSRAACRRGRRPDRRRLLAFDCTVTVRLTGLTCREGAARTGPRSTRTRPRRRPSGGRSRSSGPSRSPGCLQPRQTGLHSDASGARRAVAGPPRR